MHETLGMSVATLNRLYGAVLASIICIPISMDAIFGWTHTHITSSGERYTLAILLLFNGTGQPAGTHLSLLKIRQG